MVHLSIASAAELPDIIELFHQIDLHYSGDEAPAMEQIAAYARDNLFQPHCGVQIALAREDGRALGIATFAILYPAPGMTGQLFMKDLFTVPAARGKGLGKALLRFLARHALEHGCGRFDWTAERTNPAALDFYDRLGVPRVQDKVYYRLSGDGLRAMADPTSSAGR